MKLLSSVMFFFYYQHCSIVFNAELLVAYYLDFDVIFDLSVYSL